MRVLTWLYAALVDLFHLFLAPWPDGEPDPSDLPRWARALIAAALLALIVAGVVWLAR